METTNNQNNPMEEENDETSPANQEEPESPKPTSKDLFLEKLSHLEKEHGFRFSSKKTAVNHFFDNVLPARFFQRAVTNHYISSLEKAAEQNPRATQKLFRTLPEMYSHQISLRKINKWLNQGLDELMVSDSVDYFDFNNQDTRSKIFESYQESLSGKRLAAGVLTSAFIAAVGLGSYGSCQSDTASPETARQKQRISELESRLTALTKLEPEETNVYEVPVDCSGDGCNGDGILDTNVPDTNAYEAQVDYGGDVAENLGGPQYSQQCPEIFSELQDSQSQYPEILDEPQSKEEQDPLRACEVQRSLLEAEVSDLETDVNDLAQRLERRRPKCPEQQECPEPQGCRPCPYTRSY